MDDASRKRGAFLQELVPLGELTEEEARSGTHATWEVLEQREKTRIAVTRGHERARMKAGGSKQHALGEGFGDDSLEEESAGLISALWCYKRDGLIARSGGLVEDHLIVDVATLRDLASSLVAYTGKLWHQKASQEISAVVRELGEQDTSREEGRDEEVSPSPSLRSSFEEARAELGSLCAKIYRDPADAMRSLEEQLLPLYLRPAAQRPPGVAAPTYTQGKEERRRFGRALQEVIDRPEEAGRPRGLDFLGHRTAERREALRAAQSNLGDAVRRYFSSLTSARGREEAQRREGRSQHSTAALPDLYRAANSSY